MSRRACILPPDIYPSNRGHYHASMQERGCSKAAQPAQVEPMVDRIGAGLLRLKQGMRGILWSVASQAGLSSTQAQILLTLLASPAPLTAGALAAQLHVRAPALSEQL